MIIITQGMWEIIHLGFAIGTTFLAQVQDFIRTNAGGLNLKRRIIEKKSEHP